MVASVAFRRTPLSLPRHDHPLQPRLQIIPVRRPVDNGDPEPGFRVAPLAAASGTISWLVQPLSTRACGDASSTVPGREPKLACRMSLAGGVAEVKILVALPVAFFARSLNLRAGKLTRCSRAA
jgi:hypothetical protein